MKIEIHPIYQILREKDDSGINVSAVEYIDEEDVIQVEYLHELGIDSEDVPF